MFIIWGLLTLDQTPSTGQTIRELVKQQGSLNQLLLREYSPVDVPQMLEKADVVALGVITDAKSYIARNEREIVTDYTFQPFSVQKRDQGSPRATTLIVRRPGGEVYIDKILARATDPEFPMFDAGQQYVLFLKRDAQENVYLPAWGAQSAFLVTHGVVRQVHDGPWNRENGRVTTEQFTAMLHSLRR